jgi:hypothetical protein
MRISSPSLYRCSTHVGPEARRKPSFYCRGRTGTTTVICMDAGEVQSCVREARTSPRPPCTRILDSEFHGRVSKILSCSSRYNLVPLSRSLLSLVISYHHRAHSSSNPIVPLRSLMSRISFGAGGNESPDIRPPPSAHSNHYYPSHRLTIRVARSWPVWLS